MPKVISIQTHKKKKKPSTYKKTYLENRVINFKFTL